MNAERGVIKQIESKTFLLKVENIRFDGKWKSNEITNEKSSGVSFFTIDSYNKDTRSGALTFCEKTNGKSNTYDFVIILKYSTRKRDVIEVQRNRIPMERTDWSSYDLRFITFNNLQEIYCSIFKTGKSSGIALEKDSEEFIEKQGENSEKRKLEDWISTEQNKRLKVEGVDTLAENLKEAFLSKEDCDITIKVEDKEYSAHKVILRNRSPEFHKLLQQDMFQKKEATIDICDCDPHIFGEFLLYLYTGKLDNMTKGNVIELYNISHKYDVNDLKLKCVGFILNNFDVDYICDVLTLATRYMEQEMLKHAITFFICNAKKIFLTTKWLSFIKEYPIQATELVIKAFNAKEIEVCDKNKSF